MLKSKLVLVAALLILPLLAVIGVLQPDGDPKPSNILETRENSEGDVSVFVTPRGDLVSDPIWNFEVTLNTHSVELLQDLAEVSDLVAGAESYSPIAWEGDASGGHHRSGILKFAPISPLPKEIELIISGIGGVDRRFRWELLTGKGGE